MRCGIENKKTEPMFSEITEPCYLKQSQKILFYRKQKKHFIQGLSDARAVPTILESLTSPLTPLPDIGRDPVSADFRACTRRISLGHNAQFSEDSKGNRTRSAAKLGDLATSRSSSLFGKPCLVAARCSSRENVIGRVYSSGFTFAHPGYHTDITHSINSPIRFSVRVTPLESIPITEFLPCASDDSLKDNLITFKGLLLVGEQLHAMICQCWRAKCHVGRIASRKPCRYYTSRKREACKLARQFFVRKIDATDI
ncbi:hypothetical protein HUJ05_012602 [Dendroctonus ponderosae]|nr:hypothetical protein HUJ05_012602 [Dendroctonus ponderosae]